MYNKVYKLHCLCDDKIKQVYGLMEILLRYSKKIILASAANKRTVVRGQQSTGCHSHSEWVSSFLTAHQHNIGYAMPYY